MTILDWRRRLRRTFYDLRLEGAGRGREAAALGLGLFIGSVPVYGFHLLLCWVVGRLLRLNRLKMYLAANISNPVFSPFLLFSELEIGGWVRRHDLHGLTLDTLRTTTPWTFGADLLIGSLIVGALLGLSVAAATLITGGLRPDDPILSALWQRASEPYLAVGITAWEFARGKLRGDPVYRALLQPGVLAPGTLVDLGCGSGLALAMIREAGRMRLEGLEVPELPVLDRLVGVELRKRSAQIARVALGDAAEIHGGDAVHAALPASGTVLLLDVLHLLPTDDQEVLLSRVAAAIEPGGVVVIREADAAGGFGFLCVRAGNRLKALATGKWRQRFAFRTHHGWAELLQRHGLRVVAQDAGKGTPFANLLVIGRRERRTALHDDPEIDDARTRAAGGAGTLGRALRARADPRAYSSPR